MVEPENQVPAGDLRLEAEGVEGMGAEAVHRQLWAAEVQPAGPALVHGKLWAPPALDSLDIPSRF